MTKIGKQKEQDLVKVIIDYLNLKGHFVWRNNTGAFKGQYFRKRDSKMVERFHRYGLPGSSDILGISKYGKFIAIECKMVGNSLTPLQQNFLQQIADRDGNAIVAVSLDDVIREL